MTRFVLRKLLGFLATLLVAAVIVFLALDLLPGDPARFALGAGATPDAVAVLQEQLGLGAPWWQRFLGWIGGLFVGEFSFTQNQQIGALVGGRLAVTIPLAVMAMILGAAVGLSGGWWAARKPASIAGRVLAGVARVGAALPSFWLGMLLVMLFSVTLRWFPQGGFVPWSENPMAAFGSLLLPAIALALPAAAVLAQVTRDALVDVQNSDFVRTARAVGLTQREAVWRHGVRNAMLPILRALGLQFATLVAATVIVENVFYLPGLGRLIFDAINGHDLILVRSGVIILILLIAGTLFLADLANALVDPRLRSRGTR